MEQIGFDTSFKQRGWGKLNRRRATELPKGQRRESCSAGGAITEGEARRRQRQLLVSRW